MEPLSDLIQVLPDLGDLPWLIFLAINTAMLEGVTHAMELFLGFVVAFLATLTLWATLKNLKKADRMLKIAEKSIEKMEETLNLSLPMLVTTAWSKDHVFNVKVMNLSTTPIYLSRISIKFRDPSICKTISVKNQRIKEPFGREQGINFGITISIFEANCAHAYLKENTTRITEAIESVIVHDNNDNRVSSLPDSELDNLRRWIEEQLAKRSD